MISDTIAAGITSVTLTSQVNVHWYKGAFQNTNPSKWARRNVPLYQVPPVVKPVTSVAVMPLIASQRRRRTSTGA
jgi:hypothetical protein